MKVQNALLMMLLLAIAVASCGGEDIDYESIAESFEEAINAGDANAAALLWAEDGHLIMNQDPGDFNTPVITCKGKDGLRECFEIIIDSGIKFRFSGYKEQGGSLCFQAEDSIVVAMGVRVGTDSAHLDFEGEKITFFGSTCPGGW